MNKDTHPLEAIKAWEAKQLEEAKEMYRVAVGNRDAEMIRHWDAEIRRLNGQG